MAGPERLVVLVNDLTVRGRLRLQKYGFIAARLYKDGLRGLDFYRDWEPYHHGPYSRDMAEDVQLCVDANILGEERQATQDGRTIHVYSLKSRGRKILRAMAGENGSAAKKLHDKFARLDKNNLQDLLKGACEAHPVCETNGMVKNGTFEGAATDADDYERFNPEIEKRSSR